MTNVETIDKTTEKKHTRHSNSVREVTEGKADINWQVQRATDETNDVRAAIRRAKRENVEVGEAIPQANSNV